MELKLYHARQTALRIEKPTLRRKLLHRLGEHPLLMIVPFLSGLLLIAGLVGLIVARQCSPAGPAACFAERDRTSGQLPGTTATPAMHVSERSL